MKPGRKSGIFVKPVNGRLSEHFTEEELGCQCGCGFIPEITTREINALEKYRGLDDSPVIITSWYRCADHPIEKAKERPGTHFWHKAKDCYRPGLTALEQYYLASQCVAFTGIGFYPEWNNPGLHLDHRSTFYRWAQIGGEYTPMPDITQLRALTEKHEWILMDERNSTQDKGV